LLKRTICSDHNTTKPTLNCHKSNKYPIHIFLVLPRKKKNTPISLDDLLSQGSIFLKHWNNFTGKSNNKITWTERLTDLINGDAKLNNGRIVKGTQRKFSKFIHNLIFG
jgi:hypothetical protein